MSPQDIQAQTDGTLGSISRRNAMKAGAALAGGIAVAGSATGVAAANVDSPRSTPLDMFLKIDGIDGESRNHAHEGEIDVLAWSWGMSQSGTVHRGRGGGAGKVSVQDLFITKHVDKATPNLYLHCASGRHARTATLTIRKAGGDEPIDYLVIDLENVIVTDIQTGGSTGELPVETVSLNFAQVEVKYTPQHPDGTPQESVSFGWDIQRNEER